MEPEQRESIATITGNLPFATFLMVKDQARMDLQFKHTNSLPGQLNNNTCPESGSSHFGSTSRQDPDQRELGRISVVLPDRDESKTRDVRSISPIPIKLSRCWSPNLQSEREHRRRTRQFETHRRPPRW